MLLDRNEAWLRDIADTFTSPFPSRDTDMDARFAALMQDSEGVAVVRQARAQQQCTHMIFRELLTSPVVGGIRTELMSEIAPQIDTGGVPWGIFAEATFPATNRPEDIVAAAAKVGLSIAQNLMSAVPIYGQIAQAIVGVAVAIFRLARAGQREKEVTVPWREYSRDTDEQIVNDFLVKGLAAGVDWTPLWTPALEPGPWAMRRGEGKGESAWVVGTFTSEGDPRFRGNAVGMLPGAAQLADCLQIAPVYASGVSRVDAVTNTGDFYPSVTQWGQAAWGMAQANANTGSGADLYKIQASKLVAEWEDYWQSYMGELIDQTVSAVSKHDYEHGMFLAKAVARWLTFEHRGKTHIGLASQFIAQARQGFSTTINHDIFSASKNKLVPGRQYMGPEGVTTPALRRIMRRQLAGLTNSLSCAYVRPESLPGLPAFAAFEDPGPPLDSDYSTWGEQLRAECKRARAILLEHEARWQIVNADVREIDPKFADELDAAKAQPPLKLAAVMDKKLVPEASDGPPAEPPTGGLPWGGVLSGMSRRRKKTLVALALGGAYLAYRRWG